MCSLCHDNSKESLLELKAADTVSVPSDAKSVSEAAAAAKGPRDLEYVIAVTGDALIARVFTCPGCRRRMGWGVSITFEKLRKLDDENRRGLQKILGFPETPLLGTQAEWQAAKSSAPPSRTPTLPACKK
jgi:hypothetical protein